VASGFESISTNGCITNCVAAVDGYLLSIDTPTKKEAKNVCSFFFGHYQTHGLNIQAACDHHCRFSFIAVAGPGSMGDREATRQCGLYDLIKNLPGSFAVIGDCAYEPTEHLTPIYGGNEGRRKDNDTYNFFASQLRIRIEMAFGLMVRKWCILQHPSHVPLKHIKYMMVAIAKLHNFCINEWIQTMGNFRLLNEEQELYGDDNERTSGDQSREVLHFPSDTPNVPAKLLHLYTIFLHQQWKIKFNVTFFEIGAKCNICCSKFSLHQLQNNTDTV
jgi:hypothetical protein